MFASALSPNGKMLAVGGYLSFNDDREYGRIRLINVESGEQMGLLTGNTNIVTTLTFASEGKWLASGSGDHTIRICDVGRQEEIAVLEGHTDDIYDVAFSPDGKKLVSASFDKTLRLWNIDQLDHVTYKEMIHHTAEVRSVAFAPNGRYIISGGYDDKILLWDGNGNFMKEIDTHDITTSSFSADGRKIVVVGSSSDPATVYAFPSGKKITTFSKHDNFVFASSFYGNDLIATAGGNGNDIYIWDANSGEVKSHILGKRRNVWAIAFGDGLNISFGNSYSRIDDFNRGPLEKSFHFSDMSLNLQIPEEKNFHRTKVNYLGKSFEKMGDFELKIIGGGTIQNDDSFDGRIRYYTFTSDGDVVVGSSFSLNLYRSDGTFVREFIGHTVEVWAVSVDRSGRILASASYDQTIKLWNFRILSG